MDQDPVHLNEEGRARWDQKAEFWDKLHGDEGNLFHRRLVGPVVEKLLMLQPGEQLIDIACGNGTLARRLAALGAQVTACDFSPALITKARARGQFAGPAIRYEVADATDEDALARLGEGQFDAATCTMALMDMPQIGPLFRAVIRLLKPGGRFVFATSHPAFNSNNPVFFAEMADENGVLVERRGVKVSGYLSVPPVLAVGAPGEPAAHPFYHRSLSDLLGEAFAAGLWLDGLEEPAFATEDLRMDRPLGWSQLTQIPPVLAGRLRPRP